ncbi:MAG: RluA family pseudouridine synthase [Bacilli bacterium]|nr:RluA family pseudouridine synthase [Bacilli bacterium]
MKISFEINEDNIGIKDYLIKYYSFSFFGYLRETKARILCNGEEVFLNYFCKKGDIVEISYTPIKQGGLPSINPVSVLYEDEYCLIIDKPFGVCTIPSIMHPEDAIYNRLLTYFGGSEYTIHFMTRLDKETAGLVLVCKSQYAAAIFAKKNYRFDKYYYADVVKPLENKEGLIDLPIKRSDDYRRIVVSDGRICKTEYRFISQIDNHLFRYELHLLTGRAHQIRVHLSYFGSSIYNDELYGIKEDDSYMHLQAYKIIFHHPILHKDIEVISKIKM